eukprot:scaffold608311_cov114-Attheya_sp.AAC.2
MERTCTTYQGPSRSGRPRPCNLSEGPAPFGIVVSTQDRETGCVGSCAADKTHFEPILSATASHYTRTLSSAWRRCNNTEERQGGHLRVQRRP